MMPVETSHKSQMGSTAYHIILTCTENVTSKANFNVVKLVVKAKFNRIYSLTPTDHTIDKRIRKKIKKNWLMFQLRCS